MKYPNFGELPTPRESSAVLQFSNKHQRDRFYAMVRLDEVFAATTIHKAEILVTDLLIEGLSAAAETKLRELLALPTWKDVTSSLDGATPKPVDGGKK